jgi:dipeptidyl-peptidase-4
MISKSFYLPQLKKAEFVAFFFAFLLMLIHSGSLAQQRGLKWAKEGDAYFRVEKNEIVRYTLPENQPEVIIPKKDLIPEGGKDPLGINYFAFSTDEQKLLIFTNTKRVWRLNTRGDYWVLDRQTATLKQLGRTLKPASLMFAKFSPDGKKVAYVSENNIYVEDLASSENRALTTDGSVTLINGTFDWAYEEEFFCRDGFRWSPDSKSIAFWQINSGAIKKFYMINNTDSIYSQIIPIEYPKVGQDPSSCRIGVADITSASTTWMDIPGDPVQHYIVRLEYIPGTGKLFVQQLNRKQNHSILYMVDPATGAAQQVYEETDEAWVEVFQPGNPYAIDFTNSFTWLNEGKGFLWASEKDGWRHLYAVPLDGQAETLITKGKYDVIDLKYVDLANGVVYFMASPENATQKYLYVTSLDGSGKPELLSPDILKGTHDYNFSTSGNYAIHAFSNHYTKPGREIVTIPEHKALFEKDDIIAHLDSLQVEPTTEFFTVKTKDKVEMDGWMVKPKDFDPKKKYPVVFYVYTEPASTTVSDVFGVSGNGLYGGNMAEDGYIYISLDNRGTPAPKGREWRKCIYRQIGRLNIADQAAAAEEILKWDFVDPERIAVWGWSGGGSATLNLMFQYPKIYKTGIAVAAVANQLTYDNIYQERYMGLPQENEEDFIKGSPITYAQYLEGQLLYIHGTGDDNVHYQNAEMLVNELIKHNKQFRFMPYPNRTHGIYEGEGTLNHLATMYTEFLKANCPPGGR